MIYGTFLQSPFHWYLILGGRKPSFSMFLTFQELRDSKKGKVRGHISQILIRIHQAKEAHQGPNRLGTRAHGAPTYTGRATYPNSAVERRLGSSFL